ncbi:MAG: methylenetetrahydrofolate reductase [Gracilibacteraceae bacterium]|jgi:methylenetetrahydrofolate reductase (NADPH)|nr:methylenetetrahydrofolate reductase [Gracilibacteraceae bacterium]
MPIKDLYQPSRPVISFEIFPPKKDAAVESIYAPLSQMAALRPDFISVTYGAGGSGSVNRTTQVAAHIRRQYGITVLAHLTCQGADHAKILETLRQLRAEDIHDILALRGDREPSHCPHPTSHLPLPAAHFRYAEDLIRDIREQGDFCIGAACYPEGHIECDDLALDIARLRRKQEAGADFLITQLFYDNDIFYRFLDKARRSGVTLPISAGVMPILGQAQIERMIFLCGASLPSVIVKILHKYADSPEDLRQAGIEYAAKQINGLLEHGADGVHIYTMNKPEIAEQCMKSIGRIE